MKILKNLLCNAHVHHFGFKKISILILYVLACEKTIGHCATKVCCDMFEQGMVKEDFFSQDIGAKKNPTNEIFLVLHCHTIQF
jgi:hypothetical protein